MSIVTDNTSWGTYTATELLTAFTKAEAEGDDITCFEILTEKKRREIEIMESKLYDRR